MRPKSRRYFASRSRSRMRAMVVLPSIGDAVCLDGRSGGNSPAPRRAGESRPGGVERGCRAAASRSYFSSRRSRKLAGSWLRPMEARLAALADLVGGYALAPGEEDEGQREQLDRPRDEV